MRWRAAIPVLLMLAPVCRAHPGHLVAASATVRADGEFEVRVNFDLLAFALNETPSQIDHDLMDNLLDGPAERLHKHLEQARQRMLNGVTVICDESATPLRAASIRFPGVADVHRWRDSGISPRLPVMLEACLTGHLPESTSRIAFRFPQVLGTVVLSVERPGEEMFAEPLDPGHASTTLGIRLARQNNPSAPPNRTWLVPASAGIAAIVLTRRRPWRARAPQPT